MRVLFAYRYGILGGVATQLASRMSFLRTVPGFEAELLFAADYGVVAPLSKLCRVHVEPDPAKAARIAVDGKFDLLVVIDTKEYLEAFLAISPQIPVLLEVHTTVESGLAYLAERRWPVAAHAVPSEYSRRLLVERFDVARSEDVLVIPNVVDPSELRPVPVDGDTEGPIVLWVGKLDRHKRWETYVEIAGLVRDRVPAARFWMVGGETAPDAVPLVLLDIVEALGLADRFRWFPHVDHAAMPRILSFVAASGGLSLVTSENESFGMSVAEALLCGCPVVASKVGALPELAPGADYLDLYPLDDAPAAAAVVERMLDGEHRARIGRALDGDRPTLAHRWSPATVGAEILGHYQAIIDRARR
ncbi:glycosyltransferase family 4 protein [Myxococcota bacterium]|nr:glycosyltransferase family 4 protein [Myxococcota bacterium]